MNQAQYGVKDEQGQTGEERQIDAIENGSIPQLRSLLEDLQTQLSENMANPMVQFSLKAKPIAGDRRQQAYFQEYFQNDLPDDPAATGQLLAEGTWQNQKAEYEVKLEEEREKFLMLQQQQE